MSQTLHVLCISRFFKGTDFIRGIVDAGHRVSLLTSQKLEGEAWPRECITDTYYMVEDEAGQWNKKHLIDGLSYTMRSVQFDILVALDDFDVEHVAFLREYFRIPGMGETTARYFRDKLAMRMKAKESGIPVPAFTGLFHDKDIQAFCESVPAPWLVKPRMQASAAGIKKIYHTQELWDHLDYLGQERHEYLIEQFRPGKVYHVDALSFQSEVVFSRESEYLDPPFDVAHGGGIFRSCILDKHSATSQSLKDLNARVLSAFGMQFSACHSEFILCHEDGLYYFLETSSRVGGANIAEMVEFASGINLWREWAKIEIAAKTKKPYILPQEQYSFAGIIISLASMPNPDQRIFSDEEIVWRLRKDHHIGMIVQHDRREKILELLDTYTKIIRDRFHASMPSKEKLTEE